MAALPGRAEADVLGSINGMLIEPIAETSYDTDDAKTSGRYEKDLQYDVAFDARQARFFRVPGARLI